MLGNGRRVNTISEKLLEIGPLSRIRPTLAVNLLKRLNSAKHATEAQPRSTSGNGRAEVEQLAQLGLLAYRLSDTGKTMYYWITDAGREFRAG